MLLPGGKGYKVEEVSGKEVVEDVLQKNCHN